jgi:hypothetical protein
MRKYSDNICILNIEIAEYDHDTNSDVIENNIFIKFV